MLKTLRSLATVIFAATLLAATAAATTLPPKLTAKNTRVLEGDSGETIVKLKLRLNAPALSDTSVTWKTRNGTANRGEDYVKASGRKTIKAGKQKARIKLRIKGDTEVEGKEFFKVIFADPTNLELERRRVRVIILDDD